MIDEIDKMGSDWRGDPSSAMLEVLDPSRTALSAITTSICPSTCRNDVRMHGQHARHHPGPRDHMEIISIAGYTERTSSRIASATWSPAVERNGLKPGQLKFTDEALRVVIGATRRKPGSQQPRAPDRHHSPQVRAHGSRGSPQAPDCQRQAGSHSWAREGVPRDRRRTSEPRVSTGLAWTPTGGDILFIERGRCPARAPPPDRPTGRRHEGRQAAYLPA